MEFPEKLQALRKESGMTQEQLAAKLYVSRTAVSKWESGRGYPGIDSLKAIARVFSVSLDTLLSDGALRDMAAQEEKRARHAYVGRIVCAGADLLSGATALLPLFGRESDGVIRAVPLFASPDLGAWQAFVFPAVLILLALGGVAEWLLRRAEHGKSDPLYAACAGVSMFAVAFFALTRQPYVTVWLFALLLTKGTFLLRNNA